MTEFSTLTVLALKDLLRSHNLPVNGNRLTLVDRLLRHRIPFRVPKDQHGFTDNDDLNIIIISFLDSGSIFRCLLVSRYLQRLLYRREDFWYRRATEKFSAPTMLPLSLSRYFCIFRTSELMLLVTYLLGVQDHLGRDLELLTLLTRNVPEVIFGPRMEVFSWFLMERKYSQIAYRTIIFALDPADHEDKFVYILRALSRIDDDGNLALATYQAMYEFDGPLLVTLLASDKFHIETRACEHLYQVGCRDARLNRLYMRAHVTAGRLDVVRALFPVTCWKNQYLQLAIDGRHLDIVRFFIGTKATVNGNCLVSAINAVPLSKQISYDNESLKILVLLLQHSRRWFIDMHLHALTQLANASPKVAKAIEIYLPSRICTW